MLRPAARVAGAALAAAALTMGLAAGPAYAVAPDTTITSGPQEPDNYVLPGPVTFTFTSDQGGATFVCAVDSEQLGDYHPCTSPQVLDLPFGTHFFRVKAVVGGVADPSPATRFWYVRNVPCEQAGDAYQAAQAKFFKWQNKLVKAKKRLHHARNHGTAKQFQHAKDHVRKVRTKIKKYKDAMAAATAQEAALC
jgi:hypothetical protein